MGNDNSKSEIENQQIIMQLQQQLLQQKERENTYIKNQNNNQYNNQNNNQYNNQYKSESNDNKSSSTKLLEILGNKKLMMEIDKNPSTKRKLLEKLLNHHRHMMTSNQVIRITQMLNNLPPENNNDSSKYAFQNIYQNGGSGGGSVGIGGGVGVNGGMGFNNGTTQQDNTSRQLQKQHQIDTIEALTKHYKTNAEEEEARFKIEEEKRRKDFIETQRQRRLHYQASLSELEKSDIDSLRLFQLQKNYTIDDLKTSYKKLAMKTHPDKTGGNAEQFQLVTKCYMSLLEKYKNRESEKPFNDLRTGSKDYIDKQSKSRMKNNTVSQITGNYDNDNDYNNNNNNNNEKKIDKSKFDNKLFNKIYEQNKLWESGDDGYGDWLSSNQADEAPEEIFGNKFNLNVFNSTFEDYKEKLTSQNGAIQEYKDPQELISSSTGFTDIDIFARKINDFSKPLPTAKGGKNDLAYTDLKTAYTGKGAFIDPNSVEYKTYKSVDELKKDRSNINYNMTPEQMRDYELKKRKDIEEEEKRQYLIRQRDNIVSSSYSKIHEKMLGYKGNSSY